MIQLARDTHRVVSSGRGRERVNGAARWRSVALVAGVTVVAAVVWVVIRLDLAHLDAQVLADQVRSSGAWGPVLLILLLIVQSIVSPLPSQPVLMAAGFVYGSAVGFAVGWLGVLAGACACFGLARALGRPFVERFARAERLAAVDDYVSGRGIRTTFFAVLSLRLFAHISFDVVSYGCGLVRFSFPWFLVATAAGEVRKVFLFTYLGAGLGEAPGWLGGLIAAGILGAFVVWLWISRLAARPA
jgi:uncharacterized membrane protein YdjX (TVP38/TMEM64 family)